MSIGPSINQSNHKINNNCAKDWHRHDPVVQLIFAHHGRTGISSTIALLEHYRPQMDDETRERADKTVRCLETGEYFK